MKSRWNFVLHFSPRKRNWSANRPVQNSKPIYFLQNQRAWSPNRNRQYFKLCRNEWLISEQRLYWKAKCSHSLTSKFSTNNTMQMKGRAIIWRCSFHLRVVLNNWLAFTFQELLKADHALGNHEELVIVLINGSCWNHKHILEEFFTQQCPHGRINVDPANLIQSSIHQILQALKRNLKRQCNREAQ